MKKTTTMSTFRTRPLGRRALLRGGAAGIGVTLALPALEAMFNDHGTVYAADGTPPAKRFGTFYWGDGYRPEKWVPADTSANWTSDSLEPLAAVKPYVNVLTGLECKFRGTTHHTGRSAALSGFYDPKFGTALGGSSVPSADQLVSNLWRGSTPFESIQVGISMRRKSGIDLRPATTAASWDASFKMPRPDYSPAALYQRLFQNVMAGPSDDPKRAKELLARRSVIDLVSADAKALQARLGKNDRARIDQHLEGLRALESGLSISAGAGCAPHAPGSPDPSVDLGHEDLDTRNKLFTEIIGLALACNLSRVVVVTYSVIQSDVIFWQVGAVDGNHVVTHDDRGLPNKKAPQKELHGKIVRYIMGHFAQLLGKLHDTPEGAGNLLDSMAMVATSECGDGTSHSLTEYPMLIAGRAGGALKSGLHYRSTSGESISKAMLTALRAVEPTKFPSYGKNEGQVTDTIGALAG